ncbi:MAG: CapA family protein [Synergistaceae bacterium]|nr:CapA family protein [Synergistaceae bacterium]
MTGRFILPALFAVLCIAVSTAAGAETAVLVFAGDTAFGESYRIRPEPPSLSGNGRYLPSMEFLLPLLQGASEVLVNLETPLAVPGEPAPPNKSYVHWADPTRAVAALRASGITAVSLANNHTMDLGARGLEETLATLESAGIAWTGAGRDLSGAERPLSLAIPLGNRTVPVVVLSGFEYRRNYDEKFGFYAAPGVPGVNRLDPKRFESTVHSLKTRLPGVFVIAFPHWGKNYAWRTPAQERLAHALVDAGADLVVGHGAHQVQEIELYNGKWILYGLGNFVFHSPGRYSSRGAPPYSLVARLELEEKGKTLRKTLRLYPIQCDNTVTGFRTRPVTPGEFAEVQALLLQRTDKRTASGIRTGKDALGTHLEIALP